MEILPELSPPGLEEQASIEQGIEEQERGHEGRIVNPSMFLGSLGDICRG